MERFFSKKQSRMNFPIFFFAEASIRSQLLGIGNCGDRPIVEFDNNSNPKQLPLMRYAR